MNDWEILNALFSSKIISLNGINILPSDLTIITLSLAEIRVLIRAITLSISRIKMIYIDVGV